MKKTLTTLLMLCLYLGAFAQKDIAYWNKMANGTSDALIKHFGELTLKGMRNAIISIMVVIFQICQQIIIGHRHMPWMSWSMHICVPENHGIKICFLCGGKECLNTTLPVK